jgi:hypothetical protein
MDPHQEAKLLLVIGDRKPIFDQDGAGPHQHLFKLGHVAEKLFHLSFRTEAHDTFDPGPVVPAAVEEDDFSASRQMRDISLKIPLCALAVVRGG